MTSDYVTDYARHAGQVLRYHTWPTIQNQSVGEHSWQVALIFERLFGELSPAVERYIRMHDAAELVVGDPPFPVKKNNPVLKRAYDDMEPEALTHMNVRALPELDEDTKRKIKVCDLLEMMVFGMTERELGNLLAIPIIKRTCNAAVEIVNSSLSPVESARVHQFIQEARKRHLEVLNQSNPKI